MKKIFILTLFLAILFSTPFVHADPQVPQLINLQMILADEGGNKLPDDVQQKEITLQLVDGGGNVDFEEGQTVPVVRSAISVMVGEATDGGIPYEAFKPGESKILRVKLNDQSIPQEDLLIASVPYSMYAGYATNLTDPLDAAEVILNGSIDIEHLSEALLAYIDNAMIGISAQDLENHKTEQEAHPASSIKVENNFTNLTGDDLQTILEAVDNALNIKEQQDEVIDEVIKAVEAELQAAITAAVAIETTARESADSTLQAAINQEVTDRQTADATLQAAINQEITDRQTGDTTLQANIDTEASTRATADTNLQAEIDAHEALTAEVHGVTGTVVGTSDEQTLSNKTLTETIYQGHQTMDDEACRAAYGDINGDGLFDDNDGCLVDTVDISAFKASVETTINNLADDYLRTDGSNSMEADLNMGGHSIGSVASIGATGTITAGYFSGEGASVTNLSGSNINSGTVDESYIDGDITRDTELESHTNDTNIHFTEASINHNNIQNKGTYSHADIDSHIVSTGNPHSVTAAQVGAVSESGDIMTGTLTMSSANIAMTDTYTVDGVDVSELNSHIPPTPSDNDGDGTRDLDDLYVNYDGDTMTGDLTVGNNSEIDLTVNADLSVGQNLTLGDSTNGGEFKYYVEAQEHKYEEAFLPVAYGTVWPKYANEKCYMEGVGVDRVKYLDSISCEINLQNSLCNNDGSRLVVITIRSNYSNSAADNTPAVFGKAAGCNFSIGVGYTDAAADFVVYKLPDDYKKIEGGPD